MVLARPQFILLIGIGRRGGPLSVVSVELKEEKFSMVDTWNLARMARLIGSFELAMDEAIGR